jgi:TolB protein
MRPILKALTLGLSLAIFMAGTAFSEQSYDYVDITNPFLRKIPLAVPVFKNMSGSAEERAICDEAADLLAETLDFTGYFKLMDRGAFLEDPETMGIIKENIQFKNWTVIGAEFLVTGGVLVAGDQLTIELRMFDTIKQELMEGLGKRYTVRVSDNRLREVIRLYCSEVIFQLTGDRGVFTSKIAFESTTSGNKEIFSCDFDGYNSQQITRNNSITMSPAWSSEGAWIAYTSFARGKADLYIKHLTENRGALVDEDGVNLSPAWRPGKFELAASLSRTGDAEIYLLTGEGKIIKNLTNTWGIDVSPSWSPDGEKLAFVSDRAGTQQIYIMDVESGQVRRLTYDGRQNSSPSWSPKGDKIAYQALKDGLFDIHVISTDGSGDIQLTQGTGDNESPTWAPDGSLIAFSSTREGVSRIYVMTAYGTDQRRLLTLPGQQTTPRWSLNLSGN